MGERVTREFHWQNGYIPTQTKAGGINGSIISGANVWVWGAGLLESAKGFASTGSSSGGANPLMNVGNTHGGVTGGGTVVDAFGTTWAAGSGTALKGGASIGTVSGTLKLLVSGTLVNAGIAQPSAPTLAASATAGKNDGSYSVVITLVRSATGEESTRSLPSNVIAVTLKKLVVGGVPTAVVDGIDTIGIYCSFQNFGTTGPWFHLTDVAIGAATFTIDWFNGELGGEAPIDHDPPPTCTHCFAVNNVMVAAGSYGGPGLSPSIPGSPGAYPPDFTVFLPGGGSITSCKATGFSGAVLVATASSLNGVVATNSPITPITIRQIWPTTGFATGNAWCTVEDEVYGFSGQRGAVRTNGDGPPDTTFANAVMKDFASGGFTGSNTVVGYDPKTDTIMYCRGATVLAYARSRGWWHTPMTISGSVTSATVGGQLLIDVAAGALHASELGSGTTWNCVFAFDDGGDPEMNKTVVRLRAATNSTVQLDVLTDLDTSTSASGALSAAANHSIWHHLNIRNAKSFSVKASGTASAQSLYEVVTQIVSHQVTR